MKLWLDAQLSPSVAVWIEATFGVECRAIRDLGLRDAEDSQIFFAARDAGAVVMTKDTDFIDLQEKLGPPPSVLLLRCGNTSNVRLREVLASVLPKALSLIETGEILVEIGIASSNGRRPMSDP